MKIVTDGMREVFPNKWNHIQALSSGIQTLDKEMTIC